MALVLLSRFAVLSGLLLVAACVSTSEPPTAAAEDVPLPRARPSALHDVPVPRARFVALREAPQDKPQLFQEAAPRENRTRESDELLRQWALCKLLFVEGSARRTNRPVEELLEAAYASCAEQEDELKFALARNEVPETLITETVSNIRARDREQLAKRIVAARQSH